jgi:hypothetical protein
MGHWADRCLVTSDLVSPYLPPDFDQNSIPALIRVVGYKEQIPTVIQIISREEMPDHTDAWLLGQRSFMEVYQWKGAHSSFEPSENSVINLETFKMPGGELVHFTQQ